MKKTTLLNIILIWFAWAVIVIGFQALATARFKPAWPDNAQQWTTEYTDPKTYQVGRRYLLFPFMNAQVAWDSEYYLGIATGGYDNPFLPAMSQTQSGAVIPGDTPSLAGQKYISLSYAFMPFYPAVIRLVAAPLNWLGMNPIVAATLAGVIISVLGTLAGMVALYDLTCGYLGEDGALRAGFYMLIFPTGFFLAMVYTEGLFVGLAFGCLAMLRRNRWVLAAILGACATLTRAVGVGLMIPMALTWFKSGEWMDLDLEWRQIYFRGLPRKAIGKAMLVFAPLIAFTLWKFSYYGLIFDVVEANYFGRGFLQIGQAFSVWLEAFGVMLSGRNPQQSAYYFLEFFGLAIGILACIKVMKIDPELAWFSLAVVVISWGSGQLQGIQRYILAAPAVFVMLASWGKSPAFDRIWTTLSILLMGLLAMLFAFNYWVA